MIFWSSLLMEEILHQLISSLSDYLQGFIHLGWCRISSINSPLTTLLLFQMFRCRTAVSQFGSSNMAEAEWAAGTSGPLYVSRGAYRFLKIWFLDMVGASLIFTCLFTNYCVSWFALGCLTHTCEIREAPVKIFWRRNQKKRKQNVRHSAAVLCILDSGHPNQRGDAKRQERRFFFWVRNFRRRRRSLL